MVLRCLKIGDWIFEFAAYGSIAAFAFSIAAEASAAFEAMKSIGL